MGPAPRINAAGSSPLTRGKLDYDRSRGKGNRLIPAHAGKTPAHRGGPAKKRAHPRSRGENSGTMSTSSRDRGSSPLTRGKRCYASDWYVMRRLIPAHAGKTGGFLGGHAGIPAHPRSRGENRVAVYSITATGGSSPLTRGKPTSPSTWTACAGLIPAHAGKTTSASTASSQVRAHPRSRGENSRLTRSARSRAGSSPLTRGKPQKWSVVRIARRLIPAHAGKTAAAPPPISTPTAHPRSRGENHSTACTRLRTRGSSPLTRGKPGRPSGSTLWSRLIPAHAGKTP